MQIRRISPTEIPTVFNLLAENGWRKRLEDVHTFSKLIDASQVALVAASPEGVFGFARGITDGLSNGYLSMVVVDPTHRGKGIGRALITHAIGSNPQVTWVLRAGRSGASDFFAKLGFEQSSIAMERRRGQSGA